MVGTEDDNVSVGYTTVTYVGSDHGTRSLAHLSGWKWK